MARKHKTQKSLKAAREASAKAETARQELASRRAFMGKLRMGLALVPAGGVLGYVTAGIVRASVHETDLTRIGNGRPSVVQIHDPQCSRCVTLQGQTRRSLGRFEESDVNYIVANIKSPKGRDFAAQHGVSNVTLLLFDAEGNMRNIVRGPIAGGALDRILKAHVTGGG